jgi:integrase
VSISPEHAAQLMKQPDTPQGHRDGLLMCLLLDHGLRVGAAVILEVKDFDLKAGDLAFYRPKVDKTQTHKLTNRALKALRVYVAEDAPKRGSIWRASASKKDGKKKVGTLTTEGATERGLTKRARTLAKQKV